MLEKRKASRNLSFATAQVSLEGITSNEMSQAGLMRFHLYLEFKRVELPEAESRRAVSRTEGWQGLQGKERCLLRDAMLPLGMLSAAWWL